MREEKTDSKEPIMAMFLDQKQKFEEALLFYRQLEQSVPTESHWKIRRESLFQDDLGGLVPCDFELPTMMVETAIQTTDEYIAAIDNFTPDQFAAFLLGVGLNWLPFSYWGIQEMEHNLAKIEKSRAYYDKVETSIPEEEDWKIKMQSPFIALTSLAPPDTLKSSKVLEKASELVKSILHVLADRPF